MSDLEYEFKNLESDLIAKVLTIPKENIVDELKRIVSVHRDVVYDILKL